MADKDYTPPTGFLTMSEVRARLKVSKPTLGRLLRTVGVDVYEDPRDRRIRLLRAEDVARLEQPRLRVA
jgi:DNA-binding MurR/RpiR family transcriptional regulator